MKAVQWIGLILWVLFYAGYIGKVYAGKRRGIDVSRMVKGVKPVGTRAVEIFLMLITFSMAAVQIASILFYGKWELILSRGESLTTGPAAIFAGTITALAGIAFFLLAMRQMKDNWRAGIDEGQNTSFVTEGIYKISRNPAFAGFDLFYIGYGILFSNSLQLLFVLLGVFTLHMQIKEEEKHMEKKYGKLYLSYKSKVRRYAGRRRSIETFG